MSCKKLMHIVILFYILFSFDILQVSNPHLEVVFRVSARRRCGRLTRITAATSRDPRYSLGPSRQQGKNFTIFRNFLFLFYYAISGPCILGEVTGSLSLQRLSIHVLKHIPTYSFCFIPGLTKTFSSINQHVSYTCLSTLMNCKSLTLACEGQNMVGLLLDLLRCFYIYIHDTKLRILTCVPAGQAHCKTAPLSSHV